MTGGAKGVGLGCSEAFAADGYRVICVDTDAAAGAALQRKHGSVDFAAVDVTDREALGSLVSRVVRELKK